MPAFRIQFDTSQAKDFFEKAQKNSKSIKQAISRDFRPLLDEAVRDLHDEIVDRMRAAGLQARTGLMERQTKVTMVQERLTQDGVEWEVTVEGPVRAFAHEEGAIIRPGPGRQFIPVPFAEGEVEREALKGWVTGEETFYEAKKRKIREISADQGIDTDGVSEKSPTFTLFEGKGRRKLKVPIMMLRLNPVETREEKKRARRKFAAMKGRAGDTETMTADEWMASQGKSFEDTAKTMYPLFSMRRLVVIPKRPWLAPAVEKMHTKMSSALGSASARYTSGQGFMFNVVPRMSRL